MDFQDRMADPVLIQQQVSVAYLQVQAGFLLAVAFELRPVPCFGGGGILHRPA
jgi:hypothetical protein